MPLLHPLRLSFGPTLVSQIYTRMGQPSREIGPMHKVILAKQLELLRHIFPDVLFDIEQRQPEIAAQILELLKPNLFAYMTTYFPERKDILSLLEMRASRDGLDARCPLECPLLNDPDEAEGQNGPSSTIMVLGTYQFLSMDFNPNENLRRFIRDFKSLVMRHLPISLPEIHDEILTQSDLLAISTLARNVLCGRGSDYATMYYHDLVRLCFNFVDSNHSRKSSSAPVTPLRPKFSEASNYKDANESIISPASSVSENLDWELEVLSLVD